MSRKSTPGAVADQYQDSVFRNLKCRRMQIDEMWAFIGCKEKNITPKIAARNPHAGDVWLWVAIDADTKLVPAWSLGDRDALTARHFVDGLASRLASRIQLTAMASSSIWKRSRMRSEPPSIMPS